MTPAEKYAADETKNVDAHFRPELRGLLMDAFEAGESSVNADLISPKLIAALDEVRALVAEKLVAVREVNADLLEAAGAFVASYDRAMASRQAAEDEHRSGRMPEIVKSFRSAIERAEKDGAS